VAARTAPPPNGAQHVTMNTHALLATLAGAALGYAYHRVIGCSTGACPITANPYISTLYGAVMGYFAAGAR
jgi:hypothetical protein